MDNKEEIFLDRTSLRSKRFPYEPDEIGQRGRAFSHSGSMKNMARAKRSREGGGGRERREGSLASLNASIYAQVHRQVKFLSSQMASLLRRSQMIHIQSLGQMFRTKDEKGGIFIRKKNFSWPERDSNPLPHNQSGVITTTLSEQPWLHG